MLATTHDFEALLLRGRHETEHFVDVEFALNDGAIQILHVRENGCELATTREEDARLVDQAWDILGSRASGTPAWERVREMVALGRVAA